MVLTVSGPAQPLDYMLLSSLYWPASSSFTNLKKSQVMQERLFCAYSPCTLPPQNVPATAQHILPAFLPLFMLLNDASVAAGHAPNSATCVPPGCRPQFLNSQQFLFTPILLSTPLFVCIIVPPVWLRTRSVGFYWNDPTRNRGISYSLTQVRSAKNMPAALHFNPAKLLSISKVAIYFT